MSSAAVISSEHKSGHKSGDESGHESKHERLQQLTAIAASRKNLTSCHSGDVTPLEAYEYIAREGGILVDVRTVPEWQFVGIPDLSGCKGKMIQLSWKIYPDMTENSSFKQQLAEAGAQKDSALFFICRGGGRSSAAAQSMASSGYLYCFNVLSGFEGEANSQGHRGRISGWQGSGLPWKH